MASDSDRLETADKRAFEDLKEDLYENYGLHFPEDKLYSLRRKLRRRLHRLDLDSIRDYKQYLEANPDEIKPFLDIVSTNKTNFFREMGHWEFLRDQIVPARDRDRQLTIWSAACSTGEEAYTAALVLEKCLPGRTAYKILGTDLSDAAVRRAMRGVYSEQALDPVFDFYGSNIAHLFTNPEPNKYKVRDSLKDRLTFRQFNLKERQYPFNNDFDLVLCRNVLMYFDKKMIQHVIDQLSQCLRPGGYLFIGHTENLTGIRHDLAKVKTGIFKLPA